MADREINCSFCGRKKSEVDILIAGVTGRSATTASNRRTPLSGGAPQGEEPVSTRGPARAPRRHQAFLDEYVIGQELPNAPSRSTTTTSVWPIQRPKARWKLKSTSSRWRDRHRKGLRPEHCPVLKVPFCSRRPSYRGRLCREDVEVCCRACCSPPSTSKAQRGLFSSTKLTRLPARATTPPSPATSVVRGAGPAQAPRVRKSTSRPGRPQAP